MSDIAIPIKTKQLVTMTNKVTGAVETFDIITGELIYSDGSLVKDHDFQYTIPQALLIADEIRKGKTLQEVGAMAGMPSLSLIYAWRRNHPDFKKLIQDAKSDRAEVMRDRAQAVLEEVTEEDTKSSKLKFDGYLKLAEKDDPQAFGKTTNAESGGVTIIVNTGIVRDQQPDIVVEPTRVEEIDEEN